MKTDKTTALRKALSHLQVLYRQCSRARPRPQEEDLFHYAVV